MQRLASVSMAALVAALLVLSLVPVRGLVSAQTPLPELVQRVKPSIAWVTSQTDRDRECGSAFAVDPSGLLVTALHVVAHARSISVQFPANNPMPADVAAVDVKSDLAILRVAQEIPVSLPIAETVRVGQDAIIIGYPFCSGPDPTVTKGIVSGLNRVTSLGGGNLIQIDAAMNPGNSGGPVLTSDGAVIGVADQIQVWANRNVPAQAVNFAVSNDAVKGLVTTAIDSAKPHPALSLPLQSTVSVPLRYKGSASASGKIINDVVCVSPPHGALSLSSVRGELKASGALLIKTALRLRTNPDESQVADFGVLARYGPENVQVVNQQLPDLPARDVCLSYLAQSTLPGLYGLFALGFEVSYTLDYKVWSPEITGEPLPEQPATTTPAQQQPAPDQAIVTWTTQPNGSQVRVALQIVVPAGGVRQAVKVVSINPDGQAKTVYEERHDPGETVSVSTSDVPPFVIQVYVTDKMVKQITVHAQ